MPRVPKWFYKRSGQRVSIDSEGDVIIRPTYFEVSILTKAVMSVRDHLTGVYSLALAAVLKAQVRTAPAGSQAADANSLPLFLGRGLHRND